MKPRGIDPFHIALLSLWGIALAVSAIHAYDPFTWILEVFPAMIGIAVLAVSYRRFPLTNLLYVLIFMHSLILMGGGHYTYARVPLGFWMERTFHFTRNHYDRIGHFAQGFVPAIAAREVFLRKKIVKPGPWLTIIVIFGCLGVSALYELFEWVTAVTMGSSADAFLGTQGDPWDTQEDMCMAGIGAICAFLFFSRIHDRAIARLNTVRG